MAENNLVHRLDWIKDLQEHIHYLENKKISEMKKY